MRTIFLSVALGLATLTWSGLTPSAARADDGNQAKAADTVQVAWRGGRWGGWHGGWNRGWHGWGWDRPWLSYYYTPYYYGYYSPYATYYYPWYGDYYYPGYTSYYYSPLGVGYWW